MMKIDAESKIKNEQTKNMNKDKATNLLMDTIFESQDRKELNNYYKNALYVAKTEDIPLKLFDSDTLGLSDVEKDTIEFLNKKLEACEITEEQYRKIINKIQENRKNHTLLF